MVEKAKFPHNLWKVKSSILEFTLIKAESVKESVIRKHFEEQHVKIAQKTLNTHLHDLKEMGCLILIPPEKQGLFNKWGVKTFDNVKNIRKQFPGIPVNRYEKSLMIVIKDILFHTNPPRFRVLRIQLMLSLSYFDVCLNTEMGVLYTKAHEIYRLGRGFDEDQYIEACINEVYNDFVERFYIPPEIWQNVWNTHITKLLNLEVHQSSIPYPPIIDIKEEPFRKMLEKLLYPDQRLPDEIAGKSLLKEIIILVSRDILKKTLEEIKVNFPKHSTKMIFELSEAIFKEIEEKYPNELYTKIVKIKNYDLYIAHMVPFIIFEHCFNNDILTNNLLEGEIDFIKEKKKLNKSIKPGTLSYDESFIKNVFSEWEDFGNDRVMSQYADFEKLYDEYEKKYMIPYQRLHEPQEEFEDNAGKWDYLEDEEPNGSA